MFSPRDFYSKIVQYGGIDRGNLFMVNFYPSTADPMQNSDIRFFCKTAAIPGIEIASTDYKPQGYGHGMSLPQGFGSSGMSMIFILDSYNYVLRFFHNWAQRVVNYNSSTASRATSNGNLPGEFGYLRGKNGYGMTAVITKFNPHTLDITYEAILHDVYPTNVGSVNLTWDEQNAVSTLPVSFGFSEFNFSGVDAGTATGGALNRSQGEVKKLIGLGRKGQTVNDFINNNTKVTL